MTLLCNSTLLNNLFQINDDNLFEWEVALFGPPDTLYQGGYFKVTLRKQDFVLTLKLIRLIVTRVNVDREQS